MNGMNNQVPPERAPVLYMECVGSTNSVLKELALEGAEAGTAVVAERQTGGRGRRGRSFASPPGGLYMSYLLRPERPDERLSGVTAVTAAAAAETIEALTGIKTGIKWPNDIQVGGRKLCGILTEAVTCGDKLFIIVGIGINVSSQLPEELKDIACSLSEFCPEPPSAQALAEALTAKLDESFACLPEPPSGSLESYRRRCVTVGRKLADGSTAVGIDDDFSLLLRLPDGTAGRKYFGEI